MKKPQLYIIYFELFELVTLDPVSYGMFPSTDRHV